jgi:HNH endonuclease
MELPDDVEITEAAGSLLAFDLTTEFEAFFDHIAGRLDFYEQGIFLWLFRQSHLRGQSQLSISMKRDRFRLGFGSGDNTKPMSENTFTTKISSLQSKGLLRRINSGRSGTTLLVTLPTQSNIYLEAQVLPEVPVVTEIDYFADEVGRSAILRREGFQCFYCFASLKAVDYVMEHVVSRPEGANDYKNIVAACQSCNNKKGKGPAEGHLRTLRREHRISEEEFDDRVSALEELRSGKLVPTL